MSNKYGIKFPFEPYPQQQLLMNAIFESIEGCKSGCFESPTGTGKSLSVICATLHWQSLEEKRVEEQFEKIIEEEKNSTKKEGSSDNSDWLAEMLNTSSSNDKSTEKGTRQKERSLKISRDMRKRVSELAEIDKKNVRSHEAKARNTSTSKFRGFGGLPVANKGLAKTPLDKSDKDDFELLEEEFILAHYDSDDNKKRGKRNKTTKNTFSSAQLDLADKVHKRGRYEDFDSDSDEKEDEEIDEKNEFLLPQIFYCSRTHSQLAQFVEELRKTAQGRDVRCVTLGSRKNLCINPEVLKLSTDAKISDKCLDMAKAKGNSADIPAGAKKALKTTATGPCAFHKVAKEECFGDHALSKVRDIEELVDLGKQLDACPYYGTRRSIQNAQVVCMPYTTLLSADTRESMGIRLKGNVVIFDEAHNLIEAVNHANSAEVSKQSLDLASQAASTYLNRFQSVLTGRNLYYVQLLSSVVQKLLSFLEKLERLAHKNNTSEAEVSTTNTELLSANDFIFRAKLDNVNFFKLRRHIRESNLVGKIGGYSEHLAKRAAAKSSGEAVTRSTESFSAFSHAIRCVASMLTCLTNADADGRIFVSVDSQKEKGASLSSIRFLLLNPSSHFKSIAEETRSLLLLGGTLQPFQYLASSLFVQTSKPPSALTYFSCGHVVDRSNVLATVVEKGPDGLELTFTHGTKYNKSLTTSLLFTLVRLCQVAPRGMVVFMTSYSYMDFVVSQWRSGDLLKQLSRHKEIFVEPRGVAEADNLWSNYSKTVGRGSAAILFCVMGGKLSEGINFSNDLARCVVVVGMPYPDSRDPILQEKMKQADKLELCGNNGGHGTMSNAGKVLYEALCMNSVNQSIGRSIRHAGDYASILLLDKRYKQDRVIKQLPSWIQSSYCMSNSLDDVTNSLKSFYDKKKSCL